MKKKYTYRAFGLIISSEIIIPEFIHASGESHVDISLGEIPETISNIYKQGFRYQISKNEFLLRFKSWAEFYVKDGEKIIIQPMEGVDERDVRVFLLSPIVGILLHQRGYLPLHSSGICYNNGAVLFAGNSGSGKSTIALAMNRHFGHKLISDDITVVNLDKGKTVINSSFPSVKLWQDGLEKFEIPIEEVPVIRKDVLKYRYDNSAGFYDGKLSPSHLFFVEPSEVKQAQITEIKGTEKFNLLRQNIFRKNMIDELYSSEHFVISSALLNQVSCFKIVRPKNNCDPEKLAEIVHEVLQKTGKE